MKYLAIENQLFVKNIAQFLSKLDANSTIRIGIGRFNKNSDITIAGDSIINALNKKI